MSLRTSFYMKTMEYNSHTGFVVSPWKTFHYLGVHVSNNRSWNPAPRARKMAAWTLSAFRDCSQAAMLTLYKIMVCSKLDHFCPVFNPSKINDIQILEMSKRIQYQKSKIKILIQLNLSSMLQLPIQVHAQLALYKRSTKKHKKN